MHDHGHLITWFKVIVAIGVLFIVLGVGFIAWRSIHNDAICANLLGVGAKWSGGDSCTPPPVMEHGLAYGGVA